MKKPSAQTQRPTAVAARAAGRQPPFAEPLGRVDDAMEVQADRIADAVTSRSAVASSGLAWSMAAAGSPASPETIRRAPKDAPQQPQPAAQPAGPAGPSAADAGAHGPPGRSLLAEDDAEVTGGQMRKSEFLTALRGEICTAVDEALAGTGRDSAGCPWIDHWLDYYRERSASQVELALHRYAPETRGASSTDNYIGAVTAKVRRSAVTWARTGEITGIPQDIPAGVMPGDGVLGTAGGMFFKARPGGPRITQTAHSIHEQLGEGRELPGQLRSRMEPVFGASFAGVRLHADAQGAQLSDQLNARAFTVGRHVAFGAGEFRPGTLAGDALIAHELAHVVQQGASETAGATTKAGDGTGLLEADADRSAASVMASIWGGAKQSVGTVRANARPRVRSGLRLSRCGKSAHQKEVERLGQVQSGFLEDKRKAEEARLKKEADEEAKKKGLPPPAVAPKVELEDVVKKDVAQHALKGSPTTAWDTADQPAWKKRAADVWVKVLASVKGTELEAIASGVTFNFDPKAALEGGFYASQNGHTLTVGMSWVQIAEQDPKNVWENLAHEMAGHFKYGTTYAAEIMEAALSKLSPDERKRVKGDTQKFFETYEYPETEIYASLWQRRYRVPLVGKELPSGGIHPDDNITNKLKVIKDALAPEVAKAVLQELKRRVDANKEILQRDKDFFVVKVKEIMGISL